MPRAVSSAARRRGGAGVVAARAVRAANLSARGALVGDAIPPYDPLWRRSVGGAGNAARASDADVTSAESESFAHRVERRRLRAVALTSLLPRAIGSMDTFFADPVFVFSAGDERWHVDTGAPFARIVYTGGSWTDKREYEDNPYQDLDGDLLEYSHNACGPEVRHLAVETRRLFDETVRDEAGSVRAVRRGRSGNATRTVANVGLVRLLVHCRVELEIDNTRKRNVVPPHDKPGKRCTPLHGLYTVPVPDRSTADELAAVSAKCLNDFVDNASNMHERYALQHDGPFWYLWDSFDRYVRTPDNPDRLLVLAPTERHELDVSGLLLNRTALDLYAMAFSGARLVHPLVDQWFGRLADPEDYVRSRVGCVQRMLHRLLYTENRKNRQDLCRRYADLATFCREYLGIPTTDEPVTMGRIMEIAREHNVDCYAIDVRRRVVCHHRTDTSSLAAMVFVADNGHVVPLDVRPERTRQLSGTVRRLGLSDRDTKRQLLWHSDESVECSGVMKSAIRQRKIEKRARTARDDGRTMADLLVLSSPQEWDEFLRSRLRPLLDDVVARYSPAANPPANTTIGDVVGTTWDPAWPRTVLLEYAADLDALYAETAVRGVDLCVGLQGNDRGRITRMLVPPVELRICNNARGVVDYVAQWCRFVHDLPHEPAREDTALATPNTNAHALIAFLTSHSGAAEVWSDGMSCMNPAVHSLFAAGGALSRYNMHVQDVFRDASDRPYRGHLPHGRPRRVDMKLAYGSCLSRIRSGFAVLSLDSQVEDYDDDRCRLPDPSGEFGTVRFVPGYYFLRRDAPRVVALRRRFAAFANGHVTQELLAFLVFRGLIVPEEDVEWTLLGDPNRHGAGVDTVSLLRTYLEWLLAVLPDSKVAKGVFNRTIGTMAMKRVGSRMERVCTTDEAEAAYFQSCMTTEPGWRSVTSTRSIVDFCGEPVYCVTALRGHEPTLCHMPVLHTIVDTMSIPVLEAAMRLSHVVSIRMDAVEYTEPHPIVPNSCEDRLRVRCESFDALRATKPPAVSTLGHVQWEEPHCTEPFALLSEEAAAHDADGEIGVVTKDWYDRHVLHTTIEITPGCLDDDLPQLAELLLDCQSRSAILIGHAGNGKTHFVRNFLLPLAERLGLTFMVLTFTHGAKAPYRDVAEGERVWPVRTIDSAVRFDRRSHADCALRANDVGSNGVDLVVVEEVSMVPMDRWEALSAYKRHNPYAQLILVGDSFQNAPVESDRPHFDPESDDYFEDVMPAVCSIGTDLPPYVYRFKRQWRHADDEFMRAASREYGALDRYKASDFPVRATLDDYIPVNICHSNSTRVDMNARCERQLSALQGDPETPNALTKVWSSVDGRGRVVWSAADARGAHYRDVGAHGQYLQPWRPLVGQPVFCRSNRVVSRCEVVRVPEGSGSVPDASWNVAGDGKRPVLRVWSDAGGCDDEESTLNVDNQTRLHVTSVHENWVVMRSPECTIAVVWSVLLTDFVPGYAGTSHSWQGATLNEPGRVCDWSGLGTKGRYTAITRFRSVSLVVQVLDERPWATARRTPAVVWSPVPSDATRRTFAYDRSKIATMDADWYDSERARRRADARETHDRPQDALRMDTKESFLLPFREADERDLYERAEALSLKCHVDKMKLRMWACTQLQETRPSKLSCF